MIRIAVLLVAAAGLLAVSSGCYVHASVNSRRGYTSPTRQTPHRTNGYSARTTTTVVSGWLYYPEHDIYYSSNAGHWCYYDGGRWIVVTSRPNWFSHSNSTTVRIQYSGSRPFDDWRNHRSRWGARYHTSHRAPRVWGHGSGSSRGHSSRRTSNNGRGTSRTDEHEYEEHEYRYTERRRY